MLIALAIFFAQGLAAQTISPETLAKRAKRKNLTVKEWNTDASKKSRWLDHLTVYDQEGRKIEEIEYNQFGQIRREVCEYDPVTEKVIKEVIYDDRNKVERIRKYVPSGNMKQTEEFVLKACEHYQKYLLRKRERDR